MEVEWPEYQDDNLCPVHPNCGHVLPEINVTIEEKGIHRGTTGGHQRRLVATYHANVATDLSPFIIISRHSTKLTVS